MSEVRCPSRKKDGSLCRSPLNATQKFCSKCRWKVNKRIFEKDIRVCKGKTEDGKDCLFILKKEDEFCEECGNSAGSDVDEDDNTNELKSVDAGNSDQNVSPVANQEIKEKISIPETSNQVKEENKEVCPSDTKKSIEEKVNIVNKKGQDEEKKKETYTDTIDTGVANPETEEKINIPDTSNQVKEENKEVCPSDTKESIEEKVNIVNKKGQDDEKKKETYTDTIDTGVANPETEEKINIPDTSNQVKEENKEVCPSDTKKSIEEKVNIVNKEGQDEEKKQETYADTIDKTEENTNILNKVSQVEEGSKEMCHTDATTRDANSETEENTNISNIGSQVEEGSNGTYDETTAISILSKGALEIKDNNGQIYGNKTNRNNEDDSDVESYESAEDSELSSQLQSEEKEKQKRGSEAKTDVKTSNVDNLLQENKKHADSQHNDERSPKEGLLKNDPAKSYKPQPLVDAGRKKIAVHFHVILSTTLIKNEEKDKVLIKFDSKEQVGNYELQMKRKVGNNHIAYEGMVMVDVTKLTQHRPLTYIYAVVHKRTTTTEYLHDVQNKLERKRNLQISEQYITKGCWHQYDGVANSKTITDVQSWNWKTGINYFKGKVYDNNIKFNFEMTVAEYFKDKSEKGIVDFNYIGIDFLNDLKSFFIGLHNTYFLTLKLWSDEQKYHNEVAKTLEEILHTAIHSEKPKRQEMVLVKGVMLVHIKEKFRLRLEKEDINRLCELLLVCPSTEKLLCEDYNMVLSVFQPQIHYIRNQLLNFCIEVGNNGNPRWLYGATLLHFCFGLSTPFQEVPEQIDHDNDIPVWWGTGIFKGMIGTFKQQNPHLSKEFEETLIKLTNLFDIDYLLPRTIMATLNMTNFDAVTELAPFPCEVKLATLSYYMKSEWISKSETNQQILLQSLTGIVSEKQNQLQDQNTQLTNKSQLNRSRLSAIFAGQMLTQHVQRKNLSNYIMCCIVEIYLLSLSQYDILLEEGRERNYSSILTEKIHEIMEWLRSLSWIDPDCSLKTWNRILSVKLPKGMVNDFYQKEFQPKLEALIQQKLQDRKILEMCCNDIGNFSDIMLGNITKNALKVMEMADTGIDFDKLMGSCAQTGRIMSEHFINWWKPLQKMNNKNILSGMLTWPPLKHYLQSSHSRKANQVLTKECMDCLFEANNYLKTKLQELYNGNITFATIDAFLRNRDEFVCLMSLYEKECEVSQILEIRANEKESYTTVLDQVTTFVSMCGHFLVNTSHLQGKINDSEIKLEEICLNEVIKPSVLCDDTTNTVDIIAFTFSKEEFEVLEKIYRCHKSHIFFKLWRKHGQFAVANNDNSEILVADVFNVVWKNTYSDWKKTCQEIASGSILVTEFNRLFKQIPDERLQTELEYMSDETGSDWVQERIHQVKQHRLLAAFVGNAGVILDIVNLLGITGDFVPIETVASVKSNTDIQLKQIDETLLNACEFLQNITQDQIKCLKVFGQCKPLVDWLRDSMKSGLKELKVFVDLAMMSAGEGDMDVDKVQCLHTATVGYSPLIFQLNSDVDHQEFMKQCEAVWNNLETNPNLPDQLQDTCRELEWLKTVKQAHGSVEVTSLSQAELINSNGVYCVGEKTLEQKTKFDVRDVMTLYVSQSEDKKHAQKRYHYDQLLDLQSRLMLVAGKAEKGNDEVERFTMILDAVIRLSHVYEHLIKSGCAIFSSWQFRFLCDPKRGVCAFLQLGFESGAQILKGKGGNTETDLTIVIPKIAKFLEDCLSNWHSYISDMRFQYPLLNSFTIDQIIILQRELIKIIEDKPHSQQIYPLLAAVKRNCSHAELHQAIAESKENLKSIDAEKGSEDRPPETEDNTTKSIEKFILDVTNSGYSEEMARMALEHFSPEQVDEAIVWCIDNENLMMKKPLSDETSEKKDENITTKLMKNFTVTKGDDKKDELLEGLKQLWEHFISNVTSVATSDYLNIQQLGLILEHLYMKETFEVTRSFLKCFQAGVPNLLICPQGEIFKTVLLIYEHENEQPLPQWDEVLVCSRTTTIDELDIFWRRSLYSNSGRVYTLVNVDLLDYDVSDQAEKQLELHMKKATEQNLQYKVVVICSSENENKSRIAATLDKFKRPPLKIGTHESIQTYVANKLQIKNSDSNPKPAAHVDPYRSSVRIIKSWKAGVGKTLYVKRQASELKRLNTVNLEKGCITSIPLHEKYIDIDAVMDNLIWEERNTLQNGTTLPKIFHIDIYHGVEEGVDAFLFQLLILGYLANSDGYVWRKADEDLYLVETMPLLSKEYATEKDEIKCLHTCLDLLPDIVCRSPEESLMILKGNNNVKGYRTSDLLFDTDEFRSEAFQRPYQYLRRHTDGKTFYGLKPSVPEGTACDCLELLLRYCGLKSPSWAELCHFVRFFNVQLMDFERSYFCSRDAQEDLPGFSKFVLEFIIQMSRGASTYCHLEEALFAEAIAEADNAFREDFATRSLSISEESPLEGLYVDDGEQSFEELVGQFQMKRTWESSPHPYLFFNSDGTTMTFLGFNIDKATGNLIGIQDGKEYVLKSNIMDKRLMEALARNQVNLNEKFDNLSRTQKLEKLCTVMGVQETHDPDDTYELTTDNAKKILAIYMRFRCDIPVIIMGETGSGKTRLVKFLCSLQSKDDKNMILMKVHGGTKAKDIVAKVYAAEEVANANKQRNVHKAYTVLFFDEANTTEAIGVIKEIMCDKTVAGKPIKLCENLKIVAACNPYRKHSDELIRSLEQAGLGYHVNAEDTTDTFGRVPLRRLVYRVQPLPQSLLPFVWDFGQLTTDVEELYTGQMVLRFIRSGKLPNLSGLKTVVSKIITVSQNFRRTQTDECSFVSLRDVERVLEVMGWFYSQACDEHDALFEQMTYNNTVEEDEAGNEKEELYIRSVDAITMAMVLSLGVCYHACIKRREEYRKHITSYFKEPLMGVGEREMLEIIERCQRIFLNNVALGENIAKNNALMENVFMMTICIDLKIPLFLVGKPGSSKSLAKTIVSDAMQGNAAHGDLYKRYKAVQMVSFQCSPLATSEGIIGTFRQCAKFQRGKDLNKFVSAVVLDEVGLAEDSPKMPLKTLHPLLEDGCTSDEEPMPYKKVGFIGISNWALDPAKMNRGIFVQRLIPDDRELENTAIGICNQNPLIYSRIKPIIPLLAKSYRKIFTETATSREFFGLRDFYSLLKMIYGFLSKGARQLTWKQLEHAVRRNFGGWPDLDAMEIFTSNLSSFINKTPSNLDPDCSQRGLINACLKGANSEKSDSRYLLLLTENFGALAILQQYILEDKEVITIFGSSFPNDQEYTQVCRNINRIKVCMETGKTVILLNLENLYESLYDALNQYYVKFGGENYVDLGLGTHRVKCRIHKDFRLIVIAEKKTVYDRFPIPLINRLEKQILAISTLLTPNQQTIVDQLEQWVKDFVDIGDIQRNKSGGSVKVEDVFIGYHADTCAAIVLHICQNKEVHKHRKNEILSAAKRVLLWSATPDSVLRLHSTSVSAEADENAKIYFEEQSHDSLFSYLYQQINENEQKNLFIQITTHSKLLSRKDIENMSTSLEIKGENLNILNLQSFDTEQQFSRQVRNMLDTNVQDDRLLILQCHSGNKNVNLVAGARYCIDEELQSIQTRQHTKETTGAIHVVFIVQLPRIAGRCFTEFQCGKWQSVHIDELRTPGNGMPTVADMRKNSIGMLIKKAVEEDKRLVGQSKAVVYERNFQGMERQYDMSRLIFSCVQSALSKLKDPDHKRKTERVKYMLQILRRQPIEGYKTLATGLGIHIAEILIQKESMKELMNKPTTQWLTHDAANVENVHRAGTFRRSWMQFLEMTITPLLAEVVAVIDTNRNLDILINEQMDSWSYGLWMNIINDSELSQLHSLDPLNFKNEKAEIDVKCTSQNGCVFNAELPFSWLIYQQINQVVRATETTNYDLDIQNFVNRVSEALNNTKLFKIVEEALSTNKAEVSKAYLRDFIYMSYTVKSKDELNLLCESLRVAAVLMLGRDFDRLLAELVKYHVVFDKLAHRFKSFSHIGTVWPDCSSVIVTWKPDDQCSQLLTETEMTLDVFGMYLLIKQLEPKNKDHLNTIEGQNNWLRKVYAYRPVVERIFAVFAAFDGRDKSDKTETGMDTFDVTFGEGCQKAINISRGLWTKIVVMKLFIEHVCSMDRGQSKRCQPLWILLGQNTNMKSIKSLESVEKFLRSCNKQVSIDCFGDIRACLFCKTDIEGRPVTLPCGHVICTPCFKDQITIGKDKQGASCPVCQRNIPDDLDSNEESDTLREEVKIYKEYQRRCNSFFMDIISQLCFASDSAPSDEVVEKLFSFITHQTKTSGKVVTKEMTIFDDCIDSTPVLRSFLLQLLIRSSVDKAKEFLEKYFRNVFTDENKSDLGHNIDLSLLVIQCLEDYFESSAKVQLTDEQPFGEINFASFKLLSSIEFVMAEQITIRKLNSIAEAKFGLTIAARYTQKCFVEGNLEMNPAIQGLFQAAGEFCEKTESEEPRVFFIKLLCKCYGLESYYAVCKKNDENIKKCIEVKALRGSNVQECSDRYIVCGKNYINVREQLTKSVLNDNISLIEEGIESLKSEDSTEIVQWVLAFHREVTMANLYDDDRRKTSKKFIQELCELCQHHPVLKKIHCEALLKNNIWIHDRTWNVNIGMDLKDQNMNCLLAHAWALFAIVPENNGCLLQPFKRLSFSPDMMQKSFLPTMPHDPLDEIRDIILARGIGKFYRCPNGHPYLITECGQAWTKGHCKDCGADIGGERHNLIDTNELDTGIDRTTTGHILGPAEKRSKEGFPERQMSKVECAVTRAFVNIAMCLGSNTNRQAICDIIDPPLQKDDTGTYLWQQIETDIICIQNATGKNKDDIYLMLHHILSVMIDEIANNEYGDTVCSLSEKSALQEWETAFRDKILVPALQDIDQTIDIMNSKIVNDKRIASDPLLCLLFEADEDSEKTLTKGLHDSPVVWRYRSRISVEHFSFVFDSKKNNSCQILQLFLKKEIHLRAMRFLPSIIQLQRLLLQRFHRKITEKDAEKLSIKEVRDDFKKEGKDVEFEHLLTEFKLAWEDTREAIASYTAKKPERKKYGPAAKTNEKTFVTVPKEFCLERITDETKIAVLLPSIKSAGLCSFVVVEFLARTQNSFLEQYCGLQKTHSYKDLQIIDVPDITSAHLISYHADRDILPIILANCNYSFEVGKGTTLEYDFQSIERQLIDRFLFSKSVIDINEMQLMRYKSTSTNAIAFNALRENLKQFPLEIATRQQIIEESTSLPGLCESLDKLDITISFLTSVEANPDILIEGFMIQTLEFDSPILTEKARQSCLCRHIQSLWLTMSNTRERWLAKHHQRGFETIDEAMKKPLSPEQVQNLEQFCEEITADRLSIILDYLFECMILLLSDTQNPDDENYYDYFAGRLMETLYVYAEGPYFDEDIECPEWLQDCLMSFQDIRDTPIVCANAVESWRIIFASMTKKQFENQDKILQ